ncbi:hypothetical protein EDC26_11788 [Paralcaligenes ureilyticus]|uniref:Uncharacterized protein n=1 Tax=Paralcaligenes ureilyticus TaxID=627131 RepID=A0A4R3LQS8_9BURK|nr:hypothetical protein EDC26_11788 [Paralcaligenes ureilyticus]
MQRHPRYVAPPLVGGKAVIIKAGSAKLKYRYTTRWQPQGLPLRTHTRESYDGTHKGCRYKYIPVNHVVATLMATRSPIKKHPRKPL